MLEEEFHVLEFDSLYWPTMGLIYFTLGSGFLSFGFP